MTQATTYSDATRPTGEALIEVSSVDKFFGDFQALDDINLLRFLTLIEELEERAQVLIVTHQKRTMGAADVLYGVSMAKDGVSAVIAKRMEDVTL